MRVVQLRRQSGPSGGHDAGMCRLVGWVSPAPTTLAALLGEPSLTELTELSRQHEDGWGLAWWDDGELRTVRSHEPAHASAQFRAVAQDVRADAALLHLRWATPGLAVAPDNTHPFVVGSWAFGHNGAVRPADGLDALMPTGAHDLLRGDTDSERLLHVLADRVRRHGFDEGLRATVSDVCRDLTPSSLNALLLGRGDLTAVCCHGAPSLGDAPVLAGPPEDQPGYFDLCWRRQDDAVVVSSQPLGPSSWERLANGSALVVQRGTARTREISVGTFPPATLEREQRRRAQTAVPGAS